MNDKQALDIIKEACASVVANLATHQQIGSAVMHIEDRIAELDKVEPVSEPEVTCD